VKRRGQNVEKII